MRVSTVLLVAFLHGTNPGVGAIPTRFPEINRSKMPIILETNPDDLLNILEISPDLSYKDLGDGYTSSEFEEGQAFLEKFSQFLIIFHRDDEPASLLEAIEGISMSVASYNSNASHSDRPLVQIWIAFHHKNDVEEMLPAVIKSVSWANAKFPSTVTRILLNFHMLPLDTGTLPVVWHDLKICRRPAHPQNISCGAIFDSNICQEEYAEIRKLHARENDDMVVYYPSTVSSKLASYKSGGRYCNALVRSGPGKSAVRVLNAVFIDAINKTYGYNRTAASLLWNSMTTNDNFTANRVKLILNARITTTQHTVKPKSPQVIFQRLDQLLSRPHTFNQDHFGVSIHLKNRPDITNALGLNMFSAFRKFILSTSCHEDMSFSSMRQLVHEIVSVEKSVRNEHTDNAIPVQLVLDVTVPNNVTLEKYLVESVFSTVMSARKVNPTVTAAILLNWHNCTVDFVGDFKDFLQDVQNNLERRLEVYKLLKQERKASKMNPQAKLGIILDHFALTFLTENYSAPIFKKMGRFDVIVLEVVVHTRIVKFLGVFDTLDLVVAKFKLGTKRLHDLFGRSNTAEISLYVTIWGCQSNHSDPQQLAEVVLLWGLFNEWAVREGRTVFVDTAFEMPSDCGPPTFLPGEYANRKSRCVCGLWTVQHGGAGGTWDIIDKRQFLREHYQKPHPSMKKEPPLPETSDMYRTAKMISILATVLAIVVALALSCLAWRYHAKYQWSRQDSQQFFHGRDGNSRNNSTEANERCETGPYDKEKYEVVESAFEIDWEHPLGSGEYSTVYKAVINRGNNPTITVAVKVNRRQNRGRSHQDHLSLKAAISEVKILAYLGEHPHITKMEGAFTGKLTKGQLLIFLEFCPLGSLESYLKGESREKRNVERLNENYENVILSAELSQELFRWSTEIASGMEYIASKEMVHMDLATRNVLLNSTKRAKISDFGLSRRLYSYQEYAKQQQAALPWRWMSPESLRKMVFTERSDVWAFGVTLWEMYTLGDIPYGGLSWDINFPSMLVNGLRLEKARFVHPEMEELMRCCWNVVPQERPTFTDVLGHLEEIKCD